MPSLLSTLPPELLLQISHHLKPFHLYKLLQTSKALNHAVDTEAYWERAALHAVSRHVDEMEMLEWDYQDCRFAKVHGLYSLVNVDYHASIEQVLARARAIFGHQSTASLVRAGEAVILADPYNYQDIHAAYSQEASTMKAVVKRESQLNHETTLERKLKRFQTELDNDDTYPRHVKKYFMQRMARLFNDIAHTEMIETELYLFGHMAQRF